MNLSSHPQFRYANCLDKLLMIIGILLAIVHGSSLPIMMIIFGDMTDSFVSSGDTNFPGKNLSSMKRTLAHMWKTAKEIQASLHGILMSETQLATILSCKLVTPVFCNRDTLGIFFFSEFLVSALVDFFFQINYYNAHLINHV